MLFCLPVLELGIEWLDGFHEVLIYPARLSWMNGRMILAVHNQRVVSGKAGSRVPWC